ncbi:MAG: hypothetical protein JNK78_09220 [Planctomycetes bacterium]|nr:hypothetical protein [Planctomycetota bacterium]
MNSRLVAAAFLSFVPAAPAIAQCTTQWLPGSTLTNGIVHALAVMPNGDVVAGGTFTQIEGVAANHLARWDGSTWTPLGTGVPNDVMALCVTKNGDLVVAQSWTQTSFTWLTTIDRWNGTSWTSLGAPWAPSGGFLGATMCLFEKADGTIAAGGFSGFGYALHRVATWNGTSWSPIPITAPSPVGVVYSLAETATGDLLIGGHGIDGILRWDGTATQIFAATLTSDMILELARLPNGDLLAGGKFAALGGTTANSVARHDGSAWHALGAGSGPSTVSALCVLPDGDLLAGGTFTNLGGVAASNIARWNGTAWTPLGTGVSGSSANWESVRALAFPPAGPAFVGGSFTAADGTPTTSLARIGTTCPASSSVFGYGCGTNTLAVTSPAWANGTFRATGTGLPATCWVITVTSLDAVNPGLGMDLVYPIGVPGCDLFVAPDILALALTTTGTAETSFFLPDSPPIVGVTFYHQWIPWEIANGIIASITATNALQLTAGSF